MIDMTPMHATRNHPGTKSTIGVQLNYLSVDATSGSTQPVLLHIPNQYFMGAAILKVHAQCTQCICSLEPRFAQI